ncbi:MAG: hypothetical protein M3464_22435 [Chloroflexota bacterium]|nr:hypothetical protein [Chloroflexota bacterium]
MDGQQFDRYTRQLAAPSSRRQAMTSLTGGLFGAVLALGGHEAAAKRCKQPQERCKKRSQCCHKKKFRCGFSHGAGKGTCCGMVGAPCPGNALGCCVPLLCNANNKCAER